MVDIADMGAVAPVDTGAVHFGRGDQIMIAVVIKHGSVLLLSIAGKTCRNGTQFPRARCAVIVSATFGAYRRPAGLK